MVVFSGIVYLFLFFLQAILFYTFSRKEKIQSSLLLVLNTESLVLLFISVILLYIRTRGLLTGGHLETLLFIMKETLQNVMIVTAASFFISTLRIRPLYARIWEIVLFSIVGIVFFLYCALLLSKGSLNTVLIKNDILTSEFKRLNKHTFINLYAVFFSTFFYLVITVIILIKNADVPVLYASQYKLFLYFVLLLFITYIFVPVINNRMYFDLSVFVFSLMPSAVYYFLMRKNRNWIIRSVSQLVWNKFGSPILLFDFHDNLYFANAEAENLFNIHQKNFDYELQLSDFLRIHLKDQIRERKSSTVEEVSVETASGKINTYKLDYSSLADGMNKNSGTLLVFHDITELKQMFNDMELAVNTDQLTGLSSKFMLEKKITEINLYRKYPYSAVVCNISGYKMIQDGFGKVMAEKAVEYLISVIKTRLRISDFVAYDYGNIVLLLPYTVESETESIINRILKDLEEKSALPFRIPLEYGIASRPDPYSDMHKTVESAAAIMNSRKMVNTFSTAASIVTSIREAMENSGYETGEIGSRIRDIAGKFGSYLKISSEQVKKLQLLAIFHDIGIYSIDEQIIKYPGPLPKEQKDEIKMHTIRGGNIAKKVKELNVISEEILSHHEWWNGKGYPNGLSGEQIPYLSRIIAVLDAYDAITNDRPYRSAGTKEKAIAELQKRAGKQFDPEIVEQFIVFINAGQNKTS